MPGQQVRRKNVRRKLNAMALEFHGKNVLLVDGKFLLKFVCLNIKSLLLDSIVRGTTSKEIIVMAREAGAKKVYFASCAPPIRYPNVYGIDMPTRSELVAYNRNEDEIAEEIGADKVIYEDLHDLTESVRRFNPSIETFDTSVFDGKYITGDVDESYFNYIEGERNDDDKTVNTDNESIGLHNSFRK